jgi:hypothetical protein
MEEIDYELLLAHAASRGLRNYKYSEERHKQIRSLAQKANQRQELIDYLDRNYNFIYWMTRKVRLGTINSIGGMCYDIALQNYAEITEKIDREFGGATEKK